MFDFCCNTPGLQTVDRTTINTRRQPVVCADLTENFGPWRQHSCFALADIAQAEALPLFKFETDTILIYFFHYRNFDPNYSRM